MITINYQNKTHYNMKEYEKDYLEIAKYTLKQFHKENKNIELSVTFVTKSMIQEINRDYRHLDRVTDVISFEDDTKEGNVETIGDLFICVSRAKKQAKDYGHSMYREVCFLFTHGLLHLLHMDHIQKEDEEKMIAMQNKIMNHFSIIR